MRWQTPLAILLWFWVIGAILTVVLIVSVSMLDAFEVI